ncbi:histamine H2 receptor-like [Acanthaster planci]|uniref:Histamine H2 receptor-like n=1 Tax=Acanthaster planci TaxID=133434 RepID=A0A8B7YTL2_ACAPL|nr:histamine H2 receptor-like [Acanthaster planci]
MLPHCTTCNRTSNKVPSNVIGEDCPSHVSTCDRWSQAMNLTQNLNESLGQLQDSEFAVFIGVLHILTILLIILGNSLVIEVIVHSHKLRTITSGLLLNLAVSDLAAGLLLLPFAAGSCLGTGWAYGQALCVLLGFLYALLCSASTWTLACISLERFIAINSPLKYHQLVSRRRAIMATALIWIGATLNALFPFAEGNQEAYTYLPQYTFCLLNYHSHLVTAIVLPLLAIFIPFGIMCYTYVSIGRIACSHAKRKIVECNKDHCMFVAPKTKDYRAAKILAVMAGVFLVCWIPFTVLSLWQATTQTDFPFILTAVSLWLTFLSSAINPWLYSLLNRAFRQVLRSQGVRALQAVRILRNRTETGLGDSGNASKVLNNVNRVTAENPASCEDMLLERPHSAITHCNTEPGGGEGTAEIHCTGNLLETLANTTSGTPMQDESL